MQAKISPQTKHELMQALRERYQLAAKMEKTRILDEYVAVSRCHRKHAIRLLTGIDFVGPELPTPGRRIYAEEVREALIVLWEAADRICGKRLKAVLPSLITSMERHQHLALDPAIRKLVLAASAATIDRLLTSVRSSSSQRKKRRLPAGGRTGKLQIGQLTPECCVQSVAGLSPQPAYLPVADLE
jgi:hypothetical protein